MATTFEDWYKNMAPITRAYMTLAAATTIGCHLEIVSPFTFYFNYALVRENMELWRLFTNFLFFGMFGLDFVFNMFFLVRYARMLEEGSFRGRTADFAFMLLFGSILLLAVAPYINMPFMGPSLTFMLVYVWGRRNPHVQMSFLGLFRFTAPYLPWVLLLFTFLLSHSAVVDVLGIAVGHVYYYLEDVVPRMYGYRLLRTPYPLKLLFGEGNSVSQGRNFNAADFAGQGQALGRNE